MKRLISLILSFVLLAGLLTVGATPASATTVFEPSEDMIALLKVLEGFDRYPRWDYSQWTVGYGTACPAEDLERYQRDGITEYEAELLLKKHLNGFSRTVNSFNINNSLGFNQNQFDAILLFTYNLGSGWMFWDSYIREALLNGTTGNELMYIMGQWSHAGGEVLTQLVKRRLMEYNIFTNGVYSRNLPDNYCYVLYELNGGVGENDVQCYDSDLTDEIRVIPTREGYTFAGWYTQNSGGKKVTVLDASVRNMTLYARWVEEGEPLPEDEPTEPTPEQPPMEPLTVTVSVDEVNVRSGPGTNYAIVDCVMAGTQMTITEVQTGTGYTWGKFDGGWIALMYTNYEELLEQLPPVTEPPVTEPPVTEPPVTEPPVTEPPVTEPPVNEPEDKPVMGTVTGNELRIRAGAGTWYDVVGFLMAGDRVRILEQQVVGAMTWGRIEEGWISMTYVELDEPEPPVTDPPVTEPPVTEPPVTEPPVTEPPVTEPPVTEPPVTEPPVTEPPVEEPAGLMGTVVDTDTLNVRAGAGFDYAVIGYVLGGDRVEIFEQKDADGMTWGRIEEGWISLDYVDLDEEEPPVEEPPVEEPAGLMGTVVDTDTLNVRAGAGFDYAVIGYVLGGDRVEILEQKDADGMTWGRIEEGWISLDYVDLDEDEPSGEEPPVTEPPVTEPEDKPVMGTVNTDELRIRADAGTWNEIVGYLMAGDRVEILETKYAGGMTWGRIEEGWISLDYVDLDEAEENANQILMVNTECLRVRSGAGFDYYVVGYLYYGSKVQVLDIEYADGMYWAKIDDDQWVSMDYLE